MDIRIARTDRAIEQAFMELREKNPLEKIKIKDLCAMACINKSTFYAAREFDLAHLLVEEMKSIGIEDAFVDEHCYVYGSIPATKGCEKKPALGLIAHMDTAPDAPGENVKPILHEN